MAVSWLGTSSGAPTGERNVSCTMLRTPGASYMVDVGEGTQRQFQLLQVGADPADVEG